MKKGKGDMKVIDSKKIKKIILCIIVVLMLCNFVLPNYIFAASTQQGGSWISVIAKFLCFIADSITSLLQKMMVSPYRVDETSEYKVLYSPGIIFSGTVPAFDVDYIKASAQESVMTVRYDSYVKEILADNFNNADNKYLILA